MTKPGLPQGIFSLFRLDLNVADDKETVSVLDLIVTQVNFFKALIVNQALHKKFKAQWTVEVAAYDYQSKYAFGFAYSVA